MTGAEDILFDELDFQPLEYRLLDLGEAKVREEFATFKCKNDKLTHFLRKRSLTNQDELISSTTLVYYEDNLVGFFSLINDTINATYIDSVDGVEKYTFDFYPAIKIARLATNQQYGGRGIGTHMLQESVNIALDMCDFSACRIVSVDAKTDKNPELDVVGFYEDFGFRVAQVPPGEDDDETVLMYREIKTAKDKLRAKYQKA